MPDYTVKDRESGQTITFRWHGTQPPNEADLAEVFKTVREQRAMGQRANVNIRRGPINEAGEPLPVESVGRLDAFLKERLNPALEGLAYPDSLSDLVGLAIPSAGGINVRVPLVNMLRETLGAARQAQNWRSTPQAVLERLMQWAATPADDIARQRAATAPRLVGKAPTLESALTDAVQAARQTPTDSVSLPGGNAIRPEPRYRDYRTAPDGIRPQPPRMGAYSSDATASAARSGTSSGAPPAAATPGPSRSSPAPATSFRLTPQERQALDELLAQGYDEADVLQAIAQHRGTPAAPSAASPALTAAETKEWQRLTSRGKSPEEAMALIEAQRSFQAAKGLPTSEQAQRAVIDRNTTGRWD